MLTETSFKICCSSLSFTCYWRALILGISFFDGLEPSSSEKDESESEPSDDESSSSSELEILLAGLSFFLVTFLLIIEDEALDDITDSDYFDSSSLSLEELSLFCNFLICSPVRAFFS